MTLHFIRHFRHLKKATKTQRTQWVLKKSHRNPKGIGLYLDISDTLKRKMVTFVTLKKEYSNISNILKKSNSRRFTAVRERLCIVYLKNISRDEALPGAVHNTALQHARLRQLRL